MTHDRPRNGEADLPPASVIVCTRGRPQMVSEAVESIARYAYAGVEIVVVDQSESPHPVLSQQTAIGGCDLTYLWTATSSGVSRARNDGAVAARHDILVFTDDDILATRDWPRHLLTALIAGDDQTVVTGRVEAGEPEGRATFVYDTVPGMERTVYQGRMYRDVLASGNVAMRRSTLQALGGWDDRLGPGSRYPAAEDNDLGFRLLNAGYRIVHEPEALLVHRAWRRKRDYLRVRWCYGRGKGGFYAKHLSLRDRYMLRRIFRDVASRIKRTPRGLVKARRQVLGDVFYLAGVFSALCQWLLTERGRKSRDTD